MFYPSDPARLRGVVEDYLASAGAGTVIGQVASEPRGRLRAVIVPHAGLVYSGATAALAYQQLASQADEIRHIVMIGPAHRVGTPAIALPGVDRFATPIGEVAIWAEGVEIALTQPQVVEAPVVHADEHSLEVQLPFTIKLFPEADILPLAVGWVEPEAVARVIETLWDHPGTVFIISSDLSHFLTYEAARRLDQDTVDQILRLDAAIDPDRACGAKGVSAICLVSANHGLTPQLFGLCNSGDTAGDKARVVGYTAIGFYETE
jgi:AmmeMemoRadiSam system protein B